MLLLLLVLIFLNTAQARRSFHSSLAQASYNHSRNDFTSVKCFDEAPKLYYLTYNAKENRTILQLYANKVTAIYYSILTKRRTTSAYNVIDCEGIKLGSSPALMNNQSIMCNDNTAMIYKHHHGKLYPLKLSRDDINTNGNIDLSNATIKESVQVIADIVLTIDCNDYHKISSKLRTDREKKVRSLFIWDDDGGGGSGGDDWFGWGDDGGGGSGGVDNGGDDWFGWGDDGGGGSGGVDNGGDDWFGWDDDWSGDDDFFDFLTGSDDWGISSDDDWFDNFLGYDDDSSVDTLVFTEPSTWVNWESSSFQTSYITQFTMDVAFGIVSKAVLGPQFSLGKAVIDAAVTPVIESVVEQYCPSCKPILDVYNNVNQLADSFNLFNSKSKTIEKKTSRRSRSLQTNTTINATESLVTFTINMPLNSQMPIDETAIYEKMYHALASVIESGNLEKQIHHKAKTDNVTSLQGATIIDQLAASPYSVIASPTAPTQAPTQTPSNSNSNPNDDNYYDDDGSATGANPNDDNYYDDDGSATGEICGSIFGVLGFFGLCYCYVKYKGKVVPADSSSTSVVPIGPNSSTSVVPIGP